jgi:hypothetical protein
VRARERDVRDVGARERWEREMREEKREREREMRERGREGVSEGVQCRECSE